MATPALKYTNYLLEEAVKKLNLGYHTDWFIDEIQGFDERWSSDISVKMADRDNPDKRRPYTFRVVRVKHKRPSDDCIAAGGLRAHPNVTLSGIENLAMEMSIKAWCMGILNYYGAKGGIAIDPAQFTLPELQDIFNKMIEKMVEKNIIGPFHDRLAPDLNTNPMIMQWITDHYGYMMRLKGLTDVPFNGVVTGKPESAGGIAFRKAATGVGLHYALKTFLGYLRKNRKDLNIPKEITCAINGFGNVGLYFGQFCQEPDSRIKVVAVRDLYGAVYKPDGLPLKELIAYVQSHPKKSVDGFENAIKGCEKITTKKDFFSLPVYMFIPAALEGDIGEEEAAIAQYKILLEGANSPTTREADEIFAKRGIIVIPDIYANAGGLTVSYFEHAHNIGRQNRYPVAPVPSRDDDSVRAALQHYMTENGRDLIVSAEKYQVSYRLAGNILALSRVFPNFLARRRMNE